MTRVINRLLRISLAAGSAAACLLCSDNLSLQNPGSLVTEAHAIIGRPMTPMSYAGVARRTTRRAYGYGAAYGAAGAAAVGAVAVGAAAAASPRCYQVATAYGIETRCY
jgi:hypothetical protein